MCEQEEGNSILCHWDFWGPHDEAVETLGPRGRFLAMVRPAGFYPLMVVAGCYQEVECGMTWDWDERSESGGLSREVERLKVDLWYGIAGPAGVVWCYRCCGAASPCGISQVKWGTWWRVRACWQCEVARGSPLDWGWGVSVYCCASICAVFIS